MLDVFAGYGYRPLRPLIAYVITIFAFMDILGFVSRLDKNPLSLYESLVLSLSSSLGRGFFPSNISLGDKLAAVGVTEGVIALFIEAMLIATFARRFLEG